MNQQLSELEKSGKNYVIEGYPRTRVQAIALQRMGVIPDKFFILNTSEATIYKKVRASLVASVTGDTSSTSRTLNEKEIDTIAHNTILEYNM